MPSKIALLCLCLVGIAQAMDPILAPGEMRTHMTFASSRTNTYFNFEEQSRPLNLSNRVADYREESYQLEYTYGWTREIAVVIRGSQQQRSLTSDAAKLDHDGLTGYYLAMRQRLGGSASTHIYAETGMLINEEKNEPLPLSGGGTHWFAIASYNQDFLPSRSGFEMDFGYRISGGDADDEVYFKTRLHLDFLKVVDFSLEYKALESKSEKKIEYSPLNWPNERGYQDLQVVLSRYLGTQFKLALAWMSRLKGRNQFETKGFKLMFSWWRSR